MEEEEGAAGGERVKQRSEVRWSGVVRGAIRDYIERSDTGRVVSAGSLAEMAARAGKPVDDIPVEKPESGYDRMRELEWKWHSTIRAPS